MCWNHCAKREIWACVISSRSFSAAQHWHGASPTTAMTHIAIQENLDGKVVEWMEKVSDEQYRQ
jgi:hypothetical protein